jgi:hypothetical protein
MAVGVESFERGGLTILSLTFYNEKKPNLASPFRTDLQDLTFSMTL